MISKIRSWITKEVLIRLRFTAWQEPEDGSVHIRTSILGKTISEIKFGRWELFERFEIGKEKK